MTLGHCKTSRLTGEEEQGRLAGRGAVKRRKGNYRSPLGPKIYNKKNTGHLLNFVYGLYIHLYIMNWFILYDA